METWSDDDRSKVVAHMLEQGSRCSGCGTASWEWEEDKHAYMAVTHTCPGCQQKDLMRDDQRGAPPGTSIVLVPSRLGQEMMAAADERRSKRVARDKKAEAAEAT